MRCGADKPHAGRQGNDMANSGRGIFFRRAFPAHLVPTLAAAAIVASCSFAGIPQDLPVNADGPWRPATANEGPALAAKTAFRPVAAAKTASAAGKVKSAMSADHGDAPWICTASGFGQKSKCRARAGKG